MSDLFLVWLIAIFALTVVNIALFFSMLKMYTEIFKRDNIERRHQ